MCGQFTPDYGGFGIEGLDTGTFEYCLHAFDGKGREYSCCYTYTNRDELPVTNLPTGAGISVTGQCQDPVTKLNSGMGDQGPIGTFRTAVHQVLPIP